MASSNTRCKVLALFACLAVLAVVSGGDSVQSCQLDADTFVCPELISEHVGARGDGQESCCSAVLKQRSDYFQSCGGTRPTGKASATSVSRA